MASKSYAMNSRAQFFKKPTKDLAYVTGGKNIEIYPKNPILETTKAPIIFEWGHLPGYAYNYSESRLYFKLKILRSDTNVAPGANNTDIRPINGIGKTFFKKIELFCNNVPLHSGLVDIGTKTIIDTLLEKPKNTENCLD